MPNPRIPAGLKPTATSYSSDSASGAMRTDVAGGMPRYGLAWERGSQTVNLTFLFTPLQMQIWMQFFQRVIALGTITFTIPLDTGYGVQDHECNIVPQTYQQSRNGPTWAVVFQAETVSRGYDWSTAETEALFALYEIYGEGAGQLLVDLAQYATIDSNVLDF